MLAMDVNDDVFFLDGRVTLETIASKLAPTGGSSANTRSVKDADHPQTIEGGSNAVTAGNA